jgi:hypothetical protein
VSKIEFDGMISCTLFAVDSGLELQVSGVNNDSSASVTCMGGSFYV